MKIAVTGATGFIGRHLLPRLQGPDQEVVAVTREAARMGALGGLARVVEMDLAQPPADAFDRLGRPDLLIHLAWDGLPNYKSRRHFEEELPVQYRFLKGLLEGGLPALVATGTCFEYGLQSGPLAAQQETRPDNPYGFAKDALRKQLEMLKRELPFRFTWARLFYMYGDGQSPASIYSQLREAAKRGDRRFNMSGGEQLRDYLQVEVVADLLARLALLRPDAGPVNVCSGVPRSMRALVESWVQENRWDIELNLGHYPYPDYEPMAFWGDRRPLDALLGGP
jgi:nucleoside-diphosphate-sugar epimerase